MSQPKIKGQQLDQTTLTTVVDTSLSSIFDGDVIVSSPVLGETLVFIGSPIGWRNSISVGGITAGDGLNSAGGSPIGSPISQVLSADSTVARRNTTLNTFTFAGDVSLNLNDSSQAADEDIWRISNTGSQFVISTRLDNGNAGNNALVIARTGATVNSLTVAASLRITASGEGASSALQLNSIRPTLVFNDTDAVADHGVWDITVEFSPPSFTFRTRTDAHGTGATWLEVVRSGTTVTAINFIGTSLTFNGLAVAFGSPTGGGGGDVTKGSPATHAERYLAVKTITAGAGSPLTYRLILTDEEDKYLTQGSPAPITRIEVPGNNLTAFPIGSTVTITQPVTTTIISAGSPIPTLRFFGGGSPENVFIAGLITFQKWKTHTWDVM